MNTYSFFKRTAVVFLICLMSIGGFSAAFADGHEAEGEATEEKPKINGWFQIDVDSLGTYFLVGASHPLSGGISFDSNIYVNDYLGEFDMGVTVPVIANDSMALLLPPMLGVGFEYSQPRRALCLIPANLCDPNPRVKSSVSIGQSVQFPPYLMMKTSTNSTTELT